MCFFELWLKQFTKEFLFDEFFKIRLFKIFPRNSNMSRSQKHLIADYQKNSLKIPIQKSLQINRNSEKTKSLRKCNLDLEN